MYICEMRNIVKSFYLQEEEIQILKGINLQIQKGDFVAIMGTSGSGKTTLLNLIGCLDVPTAGSYLLAGKEVSTLSDDELSEIRNKHIGFVFQSFHLLPYATVLENVMLPALYSSQTDIDFKARAMSLLQAVGLTDRAKFKPSQLSGGQQQRVAIARALINDPELLLADEPTGQLDSKTAAEIMEILRQTNLKGTTVILVTHDQNIASFARRIIHIHDGVII